MPDIVIDVTEAIEADPDQHAFELCGQVADFIIGDGAIRHQGKHDVFRHALRDQISHGGQRLLDQKRLSADHVELGEIINLVQQIVEDKIVVLKPLLAAGKATHSNIALSGFRSKQFDFLDAGSYRARETKDKLLRLDRAFGQIE